MDNIAMKLLLVLICIYLVTPAFAAVPTVNLTSPTNNNISHTDNITFFCNATDDINVSSVIFYNNINGAFSANSTKRLMELDVDSNTTLLCHFNNNYTCETSEQGVYSSTSFGSGKVFEGVLIDNYDTLKYETYGNVELGKGTIEFWINFGTDPSSGDFSLVDTGTMDMNELTISISWGIIAFELKDAYSSTSYSEADISLWSAGEWHHITAVWDVNYMENGYVTDLFLDGSNSSTTSYDSFGEIGGINNYIFIGSDADGSGQSDSIFDEFRVSNKPRNSTEILDSYNKGSDSHSSQIVNFTLNNIPDGLYQWNCLVYDNDSQSSWGPENFTIGIDTTSPPTVNTILFSPNSTDDVDPGVTINVTINVTDVTNVSNVTFQYKYDVEWINLTMDRNGDLWNSSFTTIGSERNYNYRVYSNDTLGNWNMTQNYSINVTWDYTWTRLPVNLTAYGLIDSVNPIGIVTISNTGDDTIVFTLSDDWPIIDIYYNTTEQFSVPAKSLAYVNVTGKFAQSDSTANMTITISAEPSAPGKTASPTTAITTTSMNSYSGGPYLDTSIITMPASVYQSSSGVNISATFKNIGNETAYNVTFNWSFPAGWSNTSGLLDVFVGNISAQSSTNVSNLNMNVSSSAPSGISTICFNMTRSENISYVKCQNIQVSCSNSDGVCGSGCVYTNDNDCSAPVSGESATGGGGASVPMNVVATQQKYTMSLMNPLRVDAYKGHYASFEVFVSNNDKRTIINDIKLFISGYPQSQISVNPEVIDNVLNEGKSFIVDLTIPHYIKYGSYNLSIAATGIAKRINSTENYTNVNTTSSLIFFVHSATEEETVKLIDDAKKGITEMKSLGIDTSDVEKLLNEAIDGMDVFDYDKSNELVQQVIGMQNSALKTNTLLKEIYQKLEESKKYNVDAKETDKLYALASAAFARGDYKRAEERVTGAFLAYGIEAGTSVALAKFINENQALLFVTLLATIVLIIFGYRYVTVSIYKKRIKSVGREERILSTLMKSLQSQFFEKSDVSKSDYKDGMDGYEKRLAKIKKEEASLKSQNKKFLRRSQSTEKRKTYLINAIKDAQKSHFEQDTMNKKVYQNTVNELRKELADLDVKAKSKKLFSLMFILIIAFSLSAFATPAFASDASTRAQDAIRDAEMDIIQMQKSGFGIIRANDTLTDAKVMFERENYVNALSLALYVNTIRTSAEAANELIDTVEGRIQDLESLNTSAAQMLFDRGLESFNNEIYEDAEDFFKQSLNSLDEIENEVSIQKTLESAESGGLLIFVKQEWKNILVALLILLVLAEISYKATGRVRAKINVRDLKKEKSVVETQIRSLQTKYFEQGKISKIEYSLLLKKHMDRIREIKKKIALLSK